MKIKEYFELRKKISDADLYLSDMVLLLGLASCIGVCLAGFYGIYILFCLLK